MTDSTGLVQSLKKFDQPVETENSIAFSSTRFAKNALVHQHVDRGRGGDVGAIEMSLGQPHRLYRLHENEGQETDAIRVRGQRLPVLFAKSQNRSRGRRGVPAHFLNTAQEELQPSLPIAVIANCGEPIVVLLSVCLQVDTEIEQRTVENLALAEQKCQEQTSNSAVAIQKRMNGFELRMRKATVNQRRKRLAVVEKFLESAQRLVHRWHRRRDECRVLQRAVRRPDPVLRAPKLSRISIRSAHALHERGVDLPNETER